MDTGDATGKTAAMASKYRQPVGKGCIFNDNNYSFSIGMGRMDGETRVLRGIIHYK